MKMRYKLFSLAAIMIVFTTVFGIVKLSNTDNVLAVNNYSVKQAPGTITYSESCEVLTVDEQDKIDIMTIGSSYGLSLQNINYDRCSVNIDVLILPEVSEEVVNEFEGVIRNFVAQKYLQNIDVYFNYTSIN